MGQGRRPGHIWKSLAEQFLFGKYWLGADFAAKMLRHRDAGGLLENINNATWAIYSHSPTFPSQFSISCPCLPGLDRLNVSSSPHQLQCSQDQMQMARTPSFLPKWLGILSHNLGARLCNEFLSPVLVFLSCGNFHSNGQAGY